MKKLYCILLMIFAATAMQAQDSLRSPFSVYGGGGVGLGYLLGGYRDLPAGYDDLQYEPTIYGDVQLKAGALWNEKIGFCILAGKIGRSTNGDKFNAYASTAFSGYTFLPEYSDLHSGYTYKYITPQFVYRMGREPFNITINAGYGLGYLSNANGIAMFKENGSNNFIERRYYVNNSWTGNIAAGFEFAYMRQLSQHWFINTGAYLNYSGVRHRYEMHYSNQQYGSVLHYDGGAFFSEIIHHAAAGVFVYFQWNTKEYARAYYE